MLEKHDVSSKMQNVLIKGDRTCSGLQFTFSRRRVVLCARPCTCDAGRASWNSVYDVLLNIVIPCLHTVIPDVLQRMVLYAVLVQKLAHHDSTLGCMYMYTCIAAHVVCVRVCRVCHGVCVYVQICTPV